MASGLAQTNRGRVTGMSLLGGPASRGRETPSGGTRDEAKGLFALAHS